MLLRNGASLNYIGENGSTILHKACRAGNIELVEGILSQVAYSNLILPRRLIKMFRGRGKYLRFFGRCRIGVNSTDEHRRTPLHLGCEAGHHRIVQLLIRHKAQVIPYGEGKGSGALLVRIYKDSGTPSNECSLSEF